MTLTVMAIIYAAIGVFCALWWLSRRERPTDAAWLLVAWPIALPFTLAGPARGAVQLTSTNRPVADALARARATPLAPLIPDEATCLRLQQRIDAAHAAVADIDHLLIDPTLVGGDPSGEHLARLRALRERRRDEIAVIEALFRQLRVQAEIARLTGDYADADRELVGDLVARAEALDAVLADDGFQ